MRRRKSRRLRRWLSLLGRLWERVRDVAGDRTWKILLQMACIEIQWTKQYAIWVFFLLNNR